MKRINQINWLRLAILLIVRSKRAGRWLFEKLVDAVVYLLDLLVKLWSPKLKVKKKKQT